MNLHNIVACIVFSLCYIQTTPAMFCCCSWGSKIQPAQSYKINEKKYDSFELACMDEQAETDVQEAFRHQNVVRANPHASQADLDKADSDLRRAEIKRRAAELAWHYRIKRKYF